MSPDREITPEELRELGLFDPAGQDAAERLELLQYLHSLGATRDDLIAYRDELPGLASVLAIRGGVGLTLEEAAQRSGCRSRRCGGSTASPASPTPGPTTVSSGRDSLASPPA